MTLPQSISYTSSKAKRAAENRNGTLVFALVVLSIGASLNAVASFYTPFEEALFVHERALKDSSRFNRIPLDTAITLDPEAFRAIRSRMNRQCAGVFASAFCDLDPRWGSWVKDDYGSALEALALVKESEIGTLK